MLDCYPGLPGEREGRKVGFVTVLYSLVEDRLVWVGIIETPNPETIRDLVFKNMAVVAGGLRQRGLLKY